MKRFSSHLFASKKVSKEPYDPYFSPLISLFYPTFSPLISLFYPTFCPLYPYFTLLFALNIPIFTLLFALPLLLKKNPATFIPTFFYWLLESLLRRQASHYHRNEFHLDHFQI